MSGKIGKLSATILIAFMALSAICVFQASAVPIPPHRFWGSVTIAGEPAPDGALIEAKIEGVVYESGITVDGAYGYSPNFFDVPGDDPDEPGKEGGVDGDIIEFYIDGNLAETYVEGVLTTPIIFESGGVGVDHHPVDLAIGVPPEDVDPPTVSDVEVDPPAGVVGTVFAITASVSDPSGVELVVAHLFREEEEVTGFELFDDGEHEDETAGDGIYGNTWDSTDAPTNGYSVMIYAMDGLGNAEEYYDLATFEVTEVPPGEDTEPPEIVYAEILYPIGAESAWPGDPVWIAAIVTDNVSVAWVEVSGYPLPEVLAPMEPEPEMPDLYGAELEVPCCPDPGNYTLTITALDAADNEATTTVTFVVAYSYTAYNVWITEGWNLISLPLVPEDPSIATVLAGVSFMGKDLMEAYAELHPELGWDVEELMPTVEVVWSYQARRRGRGRWTYYEPATGYGRLRYMKDGLGYWLNVSVPELPPEIPEMYYFLTVHGYELQPGPVAPPAYRVYEGWNLIGFKSTYDMPASEYLEGVEYVRIYAYSPWAQWFYPIDNLDDHLRPGQGYWVYISERGTIVP